MPPNTTSTSTSTASTKKNNRVPSSPFFAPSTPHVVISTPGGSRRTRPSTVEESKSSVGGATFNLINAIVGSGIVGIPYAIQQAGLFPGVLLICLCATLTDKSLRLLIETAKHAGAPTYETTMEACYGKFGFMFVTINMFIMSYGAMVSYLMIVKDTVPYIFGITDLGMRRGVLFLLSLTVMVPLSAQRDMANLAKTSRVSVCCDILMVCLLVYLAPIQQTFHQYFGVTTNDATTTTTSIDWSLFASKVMSLQLDTIFVGLGVLSFAFVCQHSGFIIAGSLERPTNQRWGTVTRRSLWVCAALANLCGITGYLGYMDETKGNILTNLPEDDVLANLARGMLGITMLFVYPMESFVSRHVCVVTLFAGRRAHDGEDATILNRNDRRISLTLALYLLALVPALAFENLGNVLSFTGAIGGSSLCYIGPGLIYIGVHGQQCCTIIERYWPKYKHKKNTTTTTTTTTTTDEEQERRTLLVSTEVEEQQTSMIQYCIQTTSWYILMMPLWYWMAQIGARNFKSYERELATKSPHISRISNNGTKQKKFGQQQLIQPSMLKKHSSESNINYGSLIIPPHHSNQPKVFHPPKIVQQVEEEETEIVTTPQVMDYVIAVAFMLLGIIALVAGIASLYITKT